MSLEERVDLLIINKFGSREAVGRGFRDVIAEALSQGIPVLVGLNLINEASFAEFTEGCGAEPRPDIGALRCWVAEHVLKKHDVV